MTLSLDVLLPFYGDPEYMRQAVRSLLDQSSDDWRLIVTDDCYPDETIQPWFASLDDPRIEYHRNPENLGANRNYSRALSLSHADWVVVMGADDVMQPGYVARIDQLCAEFGDEVDAIQPGVTVIDQQGLPTRTLVDALKARSRPSGTRPTAIRGGDAVVSLLRANWTYFPSLAWRRSRITSIGFRPEFDVVQDLGLLVDLLMDGGGLVVDDRPVFSYRRHAGSDSSVKTVSGTRFDEEASYFAMIARELDRRGMHREARSARLHLTSRLHALALVPTAVRTRQMRAATRLVRHAVDPR